MRDEFPDFLDDADDDPNDLDLLGGEHEDEGHDDVVVVDEYIEVIDAEPEPPPAASARSVTTPRPAVRPAVRALGAPKKPKPVAKKAKKAARKAAAKKPAAKKAKPAKKKAVAKKPAAKKKAVAKKKAAAKKR